MNDEWKDLTTLQDVACAQADGWEIEIYGIDGWVTWHECAWALGGKYRARPRQPKMKKVKLLCFYNGHVLFWAESGKGHAYTCRVPDEDKEIEVPE